MIEADGGSRARVIDERDAPRIGNAIEPVLATPAYRERAQAIAASVNATPSTHQVTAQLPGR